MILAKPHITGPDGQVTSPDVIVDRLVLDGTPHPVALVTNAAWQPIRPGAETRAGYALVAIGGGPLLMPFVSVDQGLVVLSRQAWRLRTLSEHLDHITLNGAALSTVAPVDTALQAGGGSEADLPRGVMVACTTPEAMTTAELRDPVWNRSILHRLHAEPIDHDRWGGTTPTPRYSVGPTQKDVQHYI